MTDNLNKSKAILSGLKEYINELNEPGLLAEVEKSLEIEIAKSKGSDEIIVTSVVKLTPDLLNKIKSFIQKIHKADYPIVNNVDKSILGGFTIKVNDWFFDSSLKTEVEQQKRFLLE